MIRHLNALRGLAAIQVLIFHAIAFLIPTVVEHPETTIQYLRFTPLPFLYDGNFAVCLFFVLSGYVLTAPFTKNIKSPFAVISSRWIRLAIPSICAVFFGAILFSTFPTQAASLAAELGRTGTPFHLGWWNAPRTIIDIFDDAWRQTLFGYYQTTPLPFGQRSFTQAYNGALWTISVEFQGSILVFLLCACRRWPLVWISAIVVATNWLGTSYFLPFIAGHIFAVNRVAEVEFPIPSPIIWMAGIGSIALSIYAPPGALTKLYAAVLFFFAVIQAAGVRAFLSRPWLVGLGRWSFPIYLVHWPILGFVGPWICVDVFQSTWLPARLSAAVICIALSIAAAAPFIRIDEAAVRLSRHLRDRLMSRSALKYLGYEGRMAND